MNPTFTGNAATSSHTPQSPEVGIPRRTVQVDEKTEHASNIDMTNLMREGGRRKIDKQSLDYIWRTGLAGGLAGCAVRTKVYDLRCTAQ